MISAECVVRWCSCSRRSSWWGPSVARCGCVTAKPSHRPRKWRLHSTLTSDPSTLSREIRSFLRTSCQLATGALEWASFTPRLIHEPVTPLDAYLNPSFSSPLSPSITPSLFHSKLKTYFFGKSFPPQISYHGHLGLTSSANGTVFCFYCLCRCYLMFLVR